MKKIMIFLNRHSVWLHTFALLLILSGTVIYLSSCSSGLCSNPEDQIGDPVVTEGTCKTPISASLDSDIQFPFFFEDVGASKLLDDNFNDFFSTPTTDIGNIFTNDIEDRNKYYMRLEITGKCQGEDQPFKEVFEFDDENIEWFGQVNRFLVSDYEIGDGNLVFKLFIQTPCRDQDNITAAAAAGCSFDLESDTDAFQEAFVATREVPNGQDSPAIFFDLNEFIQTDVECDCNQ